MGVPGINVEYANRFISWRLEVFQKDMSVCLAETPQGSAWMPGLITCIGWLELFAGLSEGKLDLTKLCRGRNALNAIQDFCHRYVSSYSDENLQILYEMLRHKIAHIGAPHVVHLHDGKRITWSVHTRRGAGRPALELMPYDGQINPQVSPWPVPFDHLFYVCLSTLRDDLERAVAAYQRDLHQDSNLLDRFGAAVEPYFPR